MIRTIVSVRGAMLAFIVAAAATTAGCITTNVDCDGGGGAGGCWPKAIVAPCTSGVMCRFPGNACDMSNPSAKCTDVNTGGVCSCKCQ